MSRGQMWRRWALMNVRENRPLLLPFIAHMLFIQLFFTPTPLFCYRLTVSLYSSSPRITSILDWWCVLKSHFLSHHLSGWPERLVLTVFITPPSDFIWSKGLISELGGGCCCCCSEPCQADHTWRSVSNFGQTLTRRQKPWYGICSSVPHANIPQVHLSERDPAGQLSISTKASTAVTFNDLWLISDVLRCHSETSSKSTNFRTLDDTLDVSYFTTNIFPDQLFYVLKVMNPWPTSLQSLKPSWMMAYI